MRKNDWIDLMYAKAGVDPAHQQCLAELEEWEPRFLSLRQRLSEEDRETLDMYISACEELQHHLIYIVRTLPGWAM